MLAWLALVVAASPPRAPEALPHKMDIRVAGPLAMVDVWRTVEAASRTVENKQHGTFFDLALPAGAALLDFEIVDGAERSRLTAQPEVQVRAGLAAALKMRHLPLPTTTMDESAAYRVHVTPMMDGEKAVLHYRYSALASCAADGLALAIPESLDADPVAADVTVAFQRSADGPPSGVTIAGQPAETVRGRPGALHATASTRAWELRWSYHDHARSAAEVRLFAAAAKVPGIDISKGHARKAAGRELAVLACRSSTAGTREGAERLLLLVDRSRSVGQGGLSVERALAVALVEALPPSVPFSAVTFASDTTAIFRTFRMPTREAVALLSEALDPNRLQNGTDVVAALAAARGALAAETGVRQKPTWLVLLTDGALPSSQTSEAMRKALGAVRANALVLLVRQRGDEAVPTTSLAEFARFAAHYGGVVRVIDSGSAEDIAHAVVESMAKGGDLLDVHVEDATLTHALSAGQGASTILASTAALQHGRVTLRARGLDRAVYAETAPVSVAREWLDVLTLDRTKKPVAWSGASAGVAVAVLPPPAASSRASDGVVRGRMDPGVLRNALSLAFMPRARACYLSRRAAKAGDAFLRGRMKLELNLERGELQDAVVRSSTLAKPDIEACVRSAAWSVDYPRPEHRDAPTIANLNLVFQPHTPEEAVPDASVSSAVAREIDLILGPVTFKDDFTDLIEPNNSAPP